MTQVYFYSGAADKLNTACRLSVKAMQQDMKVMIYSLDDALLDRLDKLLWVFSSTSFVPHCRIHDKLANVTPIVMGKELLQTDHRHVLLNLDEACPSAFDHFDRLIEIAGVTADDKKAARERYRFYQTHGYEINHIKLED
ncbi:MAG: DNA polymerase III subunit chi [Nitrosomonas sp.]|nr:DNA polymerase III subunit chi [Nitrosomonas sp.]